MQKEALFEPVCRDSAMTVREAEQRARRALSSGTGLFTLTMCAVMLLLLFFALYFFSAVLWDMLSILTTLSLATVDMLCICFFLLIATVAILPAVLGRLRLGGLVAAGEQPVAGEMFYYYTSPRRFLRGLWLGVLYLLSLAAPLVLTGGALLGSFLLYEHVWLEHCGEGVAVLLFVLTDLLCAALLFVLVFLAGLYAMATGLAVGNEALSPLGALQTAFDAGHGQLFTIFRFHMRCVWHLLLSVPTLGLLWLFYYAHHTTVGYFYLCRVLCAEKGTE